MFSITSTHLCTCVCVPMCHGMHTEVRGQLAPVNSLLLPYQFQEENSGVVASTFTCQAILLERIVLIAHFNWTINGSFVH